jgi:predicted nucleic acid-binding protein
MYRIYLDNCCFNRPYDDQTRLSIWLDAQAKLFVQKAILEGTFELVWSYMMDYENAANPYEERRETIAGWRRVAAIDVDTCDEIVAYAKGIMNKGIKKKDALHLACAVNAGCHYFLTTDRKILNTMFGEITAINPINFVKLIEQPQ